ncbi:MAG: PIN domain-containing protein [Opitutales bacterium]
MRPILVESSWYIQRSRMGEDPFRSLGEYSANRLIAICGIVVAEVSRRLRDRKVLEKHQRAWKLMRYIPSTQKVWETTAELARQLDRQGKILPRQDIYIAACARSINAVILTYDQHFHEIPGIDATDRIL